MLHHVFRVRNREVLDEEVERIHADVPAACGLFLDCFPHRVDHRLVLLHILRTRSVLRIHLTGTLVFAVADQLVVYPEFVEQVLEEYHPAADAEEEIVSSVMAGSVDLVGNGCKIIAAGGESFTIDDHRLAALAEIGECLAEFLQVGQAAGGIVGLEVDVFDTRVFGSLVDGIDSI